MDLDVSHNQRRLSLLKLNKSDPLFMLVAQLQKLILKHQINRKVA